MTRWPSQLLCALNSLTVPGEGDSAAGRGSQLWGRATQASSCWSPADGWDSRHKAADILNASPGRGRAWLSRRSWFRAAGSPGCSFGGLGGCRVRWLGWLPVVRVVAGRANAVHRPGGESASLVNLAAKWARHRNAGKVPWPRSVAHDNTQHFHQRRRSSVTYPSSQVSHRATQRQAAKPARCLAGCSRYTWLWPCAWRGLPTRRL